MVSDYGVSRAKWWQWWRPPGQGQQVAGSWQWWSRERALRLSHTYLTSTCHMPSTVPDAGNKKGENTLFLQLLSSSGKEKLVYNFMIKSGSDVFKEEAIFDEWVTLREWPRNSSQRWWLWYWDLNEDFRGKHSGQDIILEATANLAFFRSQKAVTWLEHTEGGRDEMDWLLQQLHFIKPTN